MKTIIIAEAGVNHNGDIDIAKRLIDVAKDSGADYVKFQTFKSEFVVAKHAKRAYYQQKNTNAKNNSDFQLDLIKKLELDKSTHIELYEYCIKKDIKFLSSAFDLESIDLLAELGVDFLKIPSGEITNYPYLKKIALLGLPIIMSTGMANLSEIEQALNVLLNFGIMRDDITVLHCTTEYPTPIQDVNLRAMLTINKTFNVRIGYSDHTPGIDVAIAAVAMGAQVIEKHFTLNRNMEGPDHKASLMPDELKAMVKGIRNIELALGDGEKKVSDSEKKNKPLVRKSIIAKTNINKGELLSEKNLTVKRPGIGISPMRWEEVLGKTAIRDFNPDDLIEI